MSPPKRPMPPRPSAVGRTPSFAPGPRRPMAPLAPLVPLAPLSPRVSERAPAPEPYMPPDLLDGPTVTSFDPPSEELPVGSDTEEVYAAALEITEPTFDDDPTHLPAEAYPAPVSAPRSAPPPPPRRSFSPPPRSVPPAPRPSIPAPRPSIPAPRASVPPAPRPSIPAPRPSHPAPANTGANPFMAPSQPPPASAAMFDDVNTAFVGGAHMAPNFAALEARASRPDWSKNLAEPLPPPRARAHSIDMGEGVVVETLAGFEPERSRNAEVSEAWRPEGLPQTDLLERPNVMRLETVKPPPQPAGIPGLAPGPMPPAHLAPPGQVGSIRPPAATIDLAAEARAGEGRVRVAYVVAGISILLLLVAILSAVLSVY